MTGKTIDTEEGKWPGLSYGGEGPAVGKDPGTDEGRRGEVPGHLRS